MKIRSPINLHYPIAVVELAKKRDDEVKRSSPLFTYTYESVVEEYDKYGEAKSVKKRFPSRFDSSAEGVISQWFIKSGTVIQRPGCVSPSSACYHC
jgi:RNA polymerase II subunit A-like phosphatase